MARLVAIFEVTYLFLSADFFVSCVFIQPLMLATQVLFYLEKCSFPVLQAVTLSLVVCFVNYCFLYQLKRQQSLLYYQSKKIYTQVQDFKQLYSLIPFGLVMVPM